MFIIPHLSYSMNYMLRLQLNAVRYTANCTCEPPMIPIRDRNPRRHTPIVTIVLIVINAVAFFYELTLASDQLQLFFNAWAVVPAQLVGSFSAEAITIFSAMFLHGGWSHLLGNMLYLWIFGDNIEDRLGSVRFLIFYLVAGIVATFAQVVLEPTSPIPMIGASGAIAGVLGGYLVLYPLVRVTTVVPIFFLRIFELPAILVLGFWFVIQLFSGVASLGAQAQTGGGVAFFAHIGGFVAGFILVRLFGTRQSYEKQLY